MTKHLYPRIYRPTFIRAILPTLIIFWIVVVDIKFPPDDKFNLVCGIAVGLVMAVGLFKISGSALPTITLFDDKIVEDSQITGRRELRKQDICGYKVVSCKYTVIELFTNNTQLRAMAVNKCYVNDSAFWDWLDGIPNLVSKK